MTGVLFHRVICVNNAFCDCRVFNIVANNRPNQNIYTVKPVLSGQSKRRLKLVFKTDYRLMQVKSIAEFSKGGILQYFRPSLSYHLSLRSLFCQFLSGRIRPVLLYEFGVTCLSERISSFFQLFFDIEINHFYTEILRLQAILGTVKFSKILLTAL